MNVNDKNEEKRERAQKSEACLYKYNIAQNQSFAHREIGLK